MSPRDALAARRWLAPLAWDALRHKPRRRGETHLLLAVADHFEPGAGGASAARALDRVKSWVEDYPRALGEFRDADGRPPRHTFFYPVEVYDRDEVDALAAFCEQGYGEVEVHLHHDDDTPASLFTTLRDAARRLAGDHGLLGRRPGFDGPSYAFVHGNWAFNNSRPDGRWCGVNDEVTVLRATGCYADFTYPSAPSPTQPPVANRITYVTGDPDRPAGHERGTPVGRGPRPDGSIVMIPGPLAVGWGRRGRGFGPVLENACVQGNQPATVDRLGRWLAAGVGVPQRPDWAFVKLHAHGAPERDRVALVGPLMAAFHRGLAQTVRDDPSFHVHYVTAREMYNLAAAAASGWTGSVDGARDFEVVRPGVTSAVRVPNVGGR